MSVLAEWTQNPLVGERAQHRLQLLLADGCVQREIGDAERDLRPRGRNEVAKDIGGRVLLGRSQSLERAREMVLDDSLRAAELAEGLEPQHVRTAIALYLPDALEHQLQVRGLDPGGHHATSIALWRVSPDSILPAATSSRTASTSSGSIVIPACGPTISA